MTLAVGSTEKRSLTQENSYLDSPPRTQLPSSRVPQAGKRALSDISNTFGGQGSPPAPSKHRAISGGPRGDAPARAPASSPESLSSPMPYHYFGRFAQTKNKEMKKLGKRTTILTLAPESAEKQYQVFKRNYSRVKEVQKELFPGERKMLKIDEAQVHISAEEVTVIEGNSRTFGSHRSVLKDGTKLERAYPIRGDGVVNMTGKKVVELHNAYKSASNACSFQDFVYSDVKSSS